MSNGIAPMNAEEDGLNLWQLLDVVKSGWRWLVGGAVMGLAAAVGYVMIVPAQYEATAVLQPATVGLSGGTKGVEVESIAQTLERLKMPTFYSEELLTACDVKMEANPRVALVKAVKPTIVKGNALIQISYRAGSAALAEGCVSAVILHLAKSQAVIASPIIKTLEAQRELTKRQLEDAERFQTQVEKRAMTLDPSDAKFSQAMLLLNAALSKREEVSKLRRQYADQSLQLSEPLTQPAKLFEPIYASDRVVFPKKTLTVLGGLVSGLVLGGVFLFVRRAWAARKIA